MLNDTRKIHGEIPSSHHEDRLQAARAQIRQLDEGAINRIAAGEVVERPASAVKELVENAIDAGATRIEISFSNGGKTLIRVKDNGCGIPPDQLPLALSRHATSKIDGSDLLNIHSFGFRGEALPSLGAVGRLTITSRAEGDDAAEYHVNGGEPQGPRPAGLSAGTVVELRDLFFATPARLKFLRTDRAEAQAIHDVVKRLAMAEPQIGFVLRDVSNGDQGRILLRADAQSGELFQAMSGRLEAILGREFVENALVVDINREGLHLSGFAALPTYSRGAAVAQFFFVNGRPVKDKQLTGALRAAYFDFLSRDRHPAAALFINCDPHLVDVNVHPAKSEVRFRDPAAVRALIVSGLRHELTNAGHRASSTVADNTLKAMMPAPVGSRGYQAQRPSAGIIYQSYQMQTPSSQNQGFAELATPSARYESAPSGRMIEDTAQEVTHEVDQRSRPLGAARAQLHENYIVAQTETGMVLVDQHAAHERLVYEKLKRQMAENGVARQVLLIPEIIELTSGEIQQLLEVVDELSAVGLVIEAFGGGAVAVRETPAILGEINATAMIRDVLDELGDLGSSNKIKENIEAVLSRIACHGSVRSGRLMRVDEMNALLREMEDTPHSGQCNHGRPTYVELKLTDIERLFGRT